LGWTCWFFRRTVSDAYSGSKEMSGHMDMAVGKIAKIKGYETLF
jgi:hypothetical protein